MQRATHAPYAVSWSGGKDSALALWRRWREQGPPAALVTMLIEDGERSRSHGLRLDVLRAQAAALDVPLELRATSWRDYEANFVAVLNDLKHDRGVTAAVFGDIDLEPHREWCVRVCEKVELACLHPLWLAQREDLLAEFLDAGFRTRLVAVQDGKLDPALLGREIDAALLDEFRRAGIDLCGENGEYHTVVTAGPCFRREVRLVPGERVLRDGYWFLDFEVAA